MALQMSVVKALNPIRDGMRESDKAKIPLVTGLALENIKQYGWSTVGELYRPHLTLTRFKNEQNDPERNLPDITHFDGQFLRLGLFEIGNNSTSVYEIGSWRLG